MPEKSRRTVWGSVPTDCSLAFALPPSVVNLWQHTRTRRGSFPLSWGRVGVPCLPRPCLQKRRLRPEGDACIAPTKRGSACVVTGTYDINHDVLQQVGDCVWVARISLRSSGPRWVPQHIQDVSHSPRPNRRSLAAQLFGRAAGGGHAPYWRADGA